MKALMIQADSFDLPVRGEWRRVLYLFGHIMIVELDKPMTVEEDKVCFHEGVEYGERHELIENYTADITEFYTENRLGAN